MPAPTVSSRAAADSSSWAHSRSGDRTAPPRRLSTGPSASAMPRWRWPPASIDASRRSRSSRNAAQPEDLGRLLGVRDGEAEHRAAARRRFAPDSAAYPLHHPLADGEADTGSAVLLAGMEPLEHAEDALGLVGIDANAVVRHGEAPGFALPFGRHVHLGPPVIGELERVREQVLED